MPSIASLFTSLFTFHTGGDFEGAQPFTIITQETSRTSIVISGSGSSPAGTTDRNSNLRANTTGDATSGTTTTTTTTTYPRAGSSTPFAPEYYEAATYNSSNVTHVGFNATNTTSGHPYNGTNTTDDEGLQVAIALANLSSINETLSENITAADSPAHYNMTSINGTSVPEDFPIHFANEFNQTSQYNTSVNTTGVPAELVSRRRVVIIPTNVSSINETWSSNFTTFAAQGSSNTTTVSPYTTSV